MNNGLYVIKTWGQMEKEFGLNEYGAIRCTGFFTREMEEDMPPHRIIHVSDNRWILPTGVAPYSIFDQMVLCKYFTPETAVTGITILNDIVNGRYIGFLDGDYVVVDDTGNIAFLKHIALRQEPRPVITIDGKEVNPEQMSDAEWAEIRRRML
jgi:hypothetical protein